MAIETEILLKTGTNEFELAEFFLGNQSFGVNVAKIREFVPFDSDLLTPIPESQPSFLGVLLVRGRTIPLIDLKAHLNVTDSKTVKRPVVLITELNDRITGFLIDEIRQIHRKTWSDLHPLTSVISTFTPQVVGSVNVNDKEVLVVDLESIIAEVFDLNMETANLAEAEAEGIEKQRRSKRVMLAEDSNMTRRQIEKCLTEAGYGNFISFNNGQDAYQFLKLLAAGESYRGVDALDLAVLDIEMPKMDGLTLCRKIKTELEMQHLPVIMFSSLINKQMAIKCERVGADAFITKPQIDQLIGFIDQFCLLTDSSAQDT